MFKNLEDLSTPSVRIRFALEALLQAETTDGFGVDMKFFHRKDENLTCFCCLGGAALIKACNNFESKDLFLNGNAWVSVSNETGIDKGVIESFETSLDSFRMGHVLSGLREMGVETNIPFDRHIAHYSWRDHFYRDMNQLADDLEAAGL